MNFRQTTGKFIIEAFREFHAKNPGIYYLFEIQVLRAIAKGRSKVGAKNIMEWIRWELYIKTTKDQSFKLNNNFTSYYARMFIRKHPQHADKFEIRRLRSFESVQAKIFV